MTDTHKVTDNAENPSTAGYLLTENHTLKPYDSSIITMNLSQIEQIEIEDKVKSDLQSSILANRTIEQLKLAEERHTSLTGT